MPEIQIFLLSIPDLIRDPGGGGRLDTGFRRYGEIRMGSKMFF
jgi:hypothetical protein